MVTIDFETYWAKDFTLSKMSMEAYIRDPRFEVIGVCVKEGDSPTEWITGSYSEIREALAEKVQGPIIAHNAAFDAAILAWHYRLHPTFIYDTLSMARAALSAQTGGAIGNSLKALSEYFGIGAKGTEVYNTMGKRRADFTPEDMERFADYCVQDVELCWKLFNILKPKLPALELGLIDLTMRMWTEPALRLDVPLLRSHLAEVQAKKAGLLAKVTADKADFMSNDKFAMILRSHGVEPPTKVSPTTGKTAYAFAKTDEGFQALLEHPDEEIQALAAARLGLKTTIEETRTQAFIDVANRSTGQLLPCFLNYYGAYNTGRFSGGGGLNVQNLPRGGTLRHAMRAPAGHKVVACDSSQVEARTLAWFAGQDDLTEGFRNNEDIYSKFASEIYGRPINKHDNPEERHVGKTCILGLGYGVGAGKLQGTLANGFIKVSLPLEECERIVKLYRSLYSKIPALWQECNKAIEVMHSGYSTCIGRVCQLPVMGDYPSIKLPNGMRLWYPELQLGTSDRGWPEYTYQKRKGLRAKLYGGAMTENIIQSLARIIVAYQMLRIDAWLKKRQAEANDSKVRRIVNMVHDEVVAVAPAEEAEETKAFMEQTMKTPLKWCKGLPVSCEADIGDTYGDAK